MRKYHKGSWKMVFGIALIIIIFGFILGVYHHFNYEDKNSNNLSEEEVMDNNDIVNDNVKEDDDIIINDNIDNDDVNNVNDDVDEEDNEREEQLEEDTKEYNYTTQDGTEVKVNANKSVTATGFSGASNYKFYLRGTTLYFLDSSVSDNEEVILAYNVKDLYLENKEVVAELYSDGEVVVSNNYITYK